jgi:hypothetical protein
VPDLKSNVSSEANNASGTQDSGSISVKLSQSEPQNRSEIVRFKQIETMAFFRGTLSRGFPIGVQTLPLARQGLLQYLPKDETFFIRMSFYCNS